MFKLVLKWLIKNDHDRHSFQRINTCYKVLWLLLMKLFFPDCHFLLNKLEIETNEEIKNMKANIFSKWKISVWEYRTIMFSYSLLQLPLKVHSQLELPAWDPTNSLTLTFERASHSPLFCRAVLGVLAASICALRARPIRFTSSLRPTSIQLPVWQGSCRGR